MLNYYRREEPILEILQGAKTVFTRSAITPPKRKPIRTKSGTMWAKCGAGPGRFWAWSAH